jgi:hypothetical protein
MKKIFLIGLLISYCTVTAQENKITYNEVVEKLIDLKALATIPEPGEKSAMWSSYDRESKIDPETGEFINWAANDDGLESAVHQERRGDGSPCRDGRPGRYCPNLVGQSRAGECEDIYRWERGATCRPSFYRLF